MIMSCLAVGCKVASHTYSPSVVAAECSGQWSLAPLCCGDDPGPGSRLAPRAVNESSRSFSVTRECPNKGLLLVESDN